MQSSAMNWQSEDATCETRAAGSNRRIRGEGGAPPHPVRLGLAGQIRRLIIKPLLDRTWPQPNTGHVFAAAASSPPPRSGSTHFPMAACRGARDRQHRPVARRAAAR